MTSNFFSIPLYSVALRLRVLQASLKAVYGAFTLAHIISFLNLDCHIVTQFQPEFPHHFSGYSHHEAGSNVTELPLEIHMICFLPLFFNQLW